MIIQNTNNKPSINVFYCDKFKKGDFKSLLEGIEEEGIPFSLKRKEKNDALSLSYEACISSNLGVGLGISEKEIALHFHKLNKETPLFIININSGNDVVKNLGSNAARLVKRMPFKEIQG